jgi:hypothetical protein
VPRRQKKARNLLDLLAPLRKMPALAGDMPTTTVAAGPRGHLRMSPLG